MQRCGLPKRRDLETSITCGQRDGKQMRYMRHTQDTIGDLSKLIDDQYDGMTLLGEVLATIKINLMKGAFDAIPQAERKEDK